MYLFGASLSLASRQFSFSAAPAPIAWPIAKLLDRVLGVNEAHAYKKAELRSFLQFHRTGEEPLRDDEIGILNGVNSGYSRIPIHEAHGLLAFRGVYSSKRLLSFL